LIELPEIKQRRFSALSIRFMVNRAMDNPKIPDSRQSATGIYNSIDWIEEKGRIMGKKLYVGNLSFDMDQAGLEQVFSEAGRVEEAVIIMDRETNRSKGFGFVSMSSDDEAKKAISMFDGKDCSGRALKVNEAKPRVERSGGGGYGRR
jgi:RNA recognition motif-containing protein